MRRIKPHAPPLVRAPVNSFEFQPCGRTPQAGYLMVSLRHRTRTGPTPSTHRLGRGLPGYLILFATHAFAPQRQSRPRRPSSPQAFLQISTHFTATPGIPPSPVRLKQHSFQGSPIVKLWASTPDYITAYAPFKPSNSEQRSPPLSYRGCWHRVSRGLFAGYRHYLPLQKEFTTRRPSSPTRRRCIRLSPIVQDSPLLPPVGVWTVSQFQCGRSSS